MAPKNPKAASAKQKPKEEQREDTLQAVVLADSYERRFAPFTLEQPRCLLPLANTPLIEYTLEFLAHAGVEDIFIYCGSHTEKVEDYINKSKWKLTSSPFRTLTLLRSTATSVGDALRDLDKRDLIIGDFLLVAGDVVSNMAIEPALAKHRARREKDKNAIMTMVLREAGAEHRTKCRGRRPVFVIDPRSERCLHYEEITRRHRGGRYVNLDPELLSRHEEIEIRADLIDCYVDICTPDVLGLWSDNFDYQSVRKSFLFGVLKDYELNGKTIHTYIVKEQYAARVRSWRTYDAVSKDIINRWTYPLCPDSNLLPGNRSSRAQSYRLQRGKIYCEDGVVLARGSIVKKRSVVGRDTSIGDGSVVGDSVLGRNCYIGKNVSIQGSYLWDNVLIGDGSTIKQAVIGNEAVIGKNCTIDPGALISYAVRIADNTTVAGSTKLTTVPQPPPPPSTALPNPVGQTGHGHPYHSPTDSSSSSSSSTSSSHLPYHHPTSAHSSTSSLSTLHSHPSPSLGPTSPITTTTTTTTPQTQTFHLEATASLLDGLTKLDSPEVIHLELLSQRLSANASDHMMRSALAAAFLRRVFALMQGAEPLGASEAVRSVFERYGGLVKQLGIFDWGKGERGDQADWLARLERECGGREGGARVLLFAVKACYDGGVVEEEGVLAWWGEDGERGGGGEGVRGLVVGLVEWLRGAEEGGESGSGSEDEDEDGDGDEEEEEEE